MWMRRCTSGAFLFASLSCGELDAVCTPFPTSSGCSAGGGVGGGEGVEDGEDWGVSESVMGEESDSDTEVVSDSDPLEFRWSNLNTSYSVISKSSPAPWQKTDGGDEQRVQPVSGLLNLHPYGWFVLTTVCYVSHALMCCRVSDHKQSGLFSICRTVSTWAHWIWCRNLIVPYTSHYVSKSPEKTKKQQQHFPPGFWLHVFWKVFCLYDFLQGHQMCNNPQMKTVL